MRGEDLLIMGFICRDCWDDEIEQRDIGFSPQSSEATLGCSYGQTCKLKNLGFPIGHHKIGKGRTRRVVSVLYQFYDARVIIGGN